MLNSAGAACRIVVKMAQQPFSRVKVGQTRATGSAACVRIDQRAHSVLVGSMNAQFLRCAKEQTAITATQDGGRGQAGVVRLALAHLRLLNCGKLSLCHCPQTGFS